VASSSPMTQLFKLLGLTAPFAYAAAVYWLFSFLERNASLAARRTISDWLKGESYTKEHVSNIAVYVFDRLYTYPLLGWRPIARTAIISTVLMVIIICTNMPVLWRLFLRAPVDIGTHWAFWLFKNIVSDYFSLFVVRQWLLIGAKRPLLALTTGPVVGALVVCAVYLALDVARFSLLESGTFVAGPEIGPLRVEARIRPCRRCGAWSTIAPTPVGVVPQGKAPFAERGSAVRANAGLAGCCAGLNHCADAPGMGVGMPTVGASAQAATRSERPCADEFLRERRDRSAPLPKLNCIPRPTSLGR